MKLHDSLELLDALCQEIPADDSVAFASMMSRMAARLWCRLGDYEDFARMAARHAELERTYHGRPATVDRSQDDPIAVAWLGGLQP